MAKRGQHNNDARDQDKSHGHNNPSKSMEIATGSYKKEETYHEQAMAGQDTGKTGQHAKNEWNTETRDPHRLARHSRAREGDLTGGRSGRGSNAGRHSRGG